MAELDLDDISRRMDGAVEALRKDLAGLRTGRASAGMLEPINVDAYGSAMPISQVGTIGVPEPRLLTVQVWDQSLIKATEKAIRDSGLGLNPQTDGNLIRVPVPELNEERRQEIAKVAGKYAEQAKIAVRNVRRDGMDTLKKAEKDGDISEDDAKHMSDEVQKLTDKHIKSIDDLYAKKEEEIKQV